VGPRPQFEVLRAVVVLDAVDVMFALDEVSPKDLLGDEDVLEDIPATRARVVGNPDHDISRLVPGPAASPVTVVRASLKRPSALTTHSLFHEQRR
jgi:hypothetical protein